MIGRGDAVTRRYQSHVEHWLPVQDMSDDALAERIRADGIDVLVDVSGHTRGNRLRVFARKPAPVSLHWLDFGYTTGLSAIDWMPSPYGRGEDDPTQPPQPVQRGRVAVADRPALAQLRAQRDQHVGAGDRAALRSPRPAHLHRRRRAACS